MKVFTIFFWPLLLISCGADLSSNPINASSVETTGSKTLKDCSCFIENGLVCGNNGQTYANNCLAICSGVRIASKGSCENKKSCNENSGQVCGRAPMPVCSPGVACAQVMPTPKYYENECSLKENNATRLEEEKCQ